MWRIGMKNGKPHVNKQLIRGANGSCQHQIRLARHQFIAGQFDRIQRGSAGRIQGIMATAQAQCFGDHFGRRVAQYLVVGLRIFMGFNFKIFIVEQLL